MEGTSPDRIDRLITDLQFCQLDLGPAMEDASPEVARPPSGVPVSRTSSSSSTQPSTTTSYRSLASSKSTGSDYQAVPPDIRSSKSVGPKQKLMAWARMKKSRSPTEPKRELPGIPRPIIKYNSMPPASPPQRFSLHSRTTIDESTEPDDRSPVELPSTHEVYELPAEGPEEWQPRVVEWDAPPYRNSQQSEPLADGYTDVRNSYGSYYSPESFEDARKVARRSLLAVELGAPWSDQPVSPLFPTPTLRPVSESPANNR